MKQPQAGEQRSGRRRPPIKRRAAFLFASYIAITGLVLGLLLWHLRDNAREEGLKLAQAFALVAEEQSVATIVAVEQALELAEAQAGASTPGAPLRSGVRPAARERAFVKWIAVLGPDGAVLKTTDERLRGASLADEPYVQPHRRFADSLFHIGRPARMPDGSWSIPVSRPLRDDAGALRGLVVAAVDPRLFDRAWQTDREAGYTISLARTDGELLMRTPFDSRAFPASGLPAAAVQRLAAGATDGHTLVAHDGPAELVVFRRLADYPGLAVSVAVPWHRLFAEWWSVVRIVGVAWILSVLAVAALTLWIVRETISRAVTQRRFRVLFDANPYPILVVHRTERRLLAANDAASRQYGRAREEMLAMKADELVAPGEPRDFVAEGLGHPGEVLTGHVHRRSDGSTFDADITVRSIEFADAPAAVAIVHDVSQRARVERERAAAEDKLRQSQKMEAVGQLTGGVAHDFNNILMLILANVEALQGEEGVDPKRQRRLGRIGEAVQRASDLTRQLLAFSRQQPLKPEITDVNELVARTGKMLRRALGEHIDIQSRLAADVSPVSVDRAQLETALLNLCLNARDAMSGGGKLVIETSNATLDEAYADSHQEVAPGNYVLISVTDTGSGIPKDVIGKIFDPFFTTKEVGKGTGLGLSMVYGFIKQSRGHIGVYSEPGRGTTFRLYLPWAAGAQAAAESLPVEVIVGGRERVIVVEDEAPVRETIVEQLGGLGYRVKEANGGAEALAAMAAEPVPFDLLLTDVVMPGTYNGKALADEVTSRWPATRVVFMSGYTQDAIAGELPPGTLLLSKPFRRRDLAAIVRRALDGRAGQETGAGAQNRILGSVLTRAGSLGASANSS